MEHLARSRLLDLKLRNEISKRLLWLRILLQSFQVVSLVGQQKRIVQLTLFELTVIASFQLRLQFPYKSRLNFL